MEGEGEEEREGEGEEEQGATGQGGREVNRRRRGRSRRARWWRARRRRELRLVGGGVGPARRSATTYLRRARRHPPRPRDAMGRAPFCQVCKGSHEPARCAGAGWWGGGGDSDTDEEAIEACGRGLHSSTFRLNLSAFCGIGGTFRDCLGGV